MGGGICRHLMVDPNALEPGRGQYASTANVVLLNAMLDEEAFHAVNHHWQAA